MSAGNAGGKKFKSPFPPMPAKPVIVDVIGGGDSDGLHFDTSSPDPGLAQPAMSIYTLTDGGAVGRSMYGASPFNTMRMAQGEQIGPEVWAKHGCYYTIVKREDKDDALRLLVQFTGGRNLPLKDEDGLKPGWANRAIHRFIDANFEDIKIEDMILFWIAQDLQNSVGAAVEKSHIETHFGDARLEDKCNRIAERLSKSLDKFVVTFQIGEEVIYFRPNPKLAAD